MTGNPELPPFFVQGPEGYADVFERGEGWQRWFCCGVSIEKAQRIADAMNAASATPALPEERVPRYEAREDCVLDSFGGQHAFRIVPIMGQTPIEVVELARLVVAALNRRLDPSASLPDEEAVERLVEKLRENIVELWHESSLSGQLHEYLCFSFDEYRAWVASPYPPVEGPK